MPKIRTRDELQRRANYLEGVAPHLPLVFHHLFAMLPDPGEEFPLEHRVAFLSAVSAIAAMVYGGAPMQIAVERTASP